MKPRVLLGSSLAFALSSSTLLAVGSGGCGQDVATCGTVCTFSDAPQGCVDTCQEEESACGALGYGGAFQALLTCVGNAGSYTYANTVCTSQEDLVASACSSATGTGGGQSSTGGGGSGTSSGGSTGSITLDAATGPSGPGVSTTKCAIGAPCDPSQAHCTNPGAGPCGSDQELTCDGAWFESGFPCNGDVGSCAFGSGTCNETCSCMNGQMICEGDCPDAGPSSP